MAAYVEAQNIYWAFSSSAQAIAAFIGFLSAGFFFSHDRMDRQINQDETLVEILTDIKTQHFRKLKSLLWLTGFSIFLSLMIVILNGFDTGNFLPVFAILVALLNIITLITAVRLIITMVDPKNVENTAEKLITERSGEIVSDSKSANFSKSEFLINFEILEDLAYEIYDREINVQLESIRFLSFSVLIRELAKSKIINNNQFEILNRVFKMRNLVSHGRTENVGIKESNELNELINFFRELLKSQS